MTIRIADLDPDGLYGEDLHLESGRWILIVETVRSLQLLDNELLNRMASPAERVEISREQARSIATHLERRSIRDLIRDYGTRPTVPAYIVPIATSNGLWIDPALPVLQHRREFPRDLLSFTTFCFACKGFSVQ